MSSTSQRLNFQPWFVNDVYIRAHNAWLPGMRLYTVVRAWAASKFVMCGGDRGTQKALILRAAGIHNDKMCTSDFFLPANWMKSKPSSCMQANSPGNDGLGAK